MVTKKPKVTSLAELEVEIYQALLAARQKDDFVGAEELYKIWIKLPSQRPNPMQALPTSRPESEGLRAESATPLAYE